MFCARRVACAARAAAQTGARRPLRTTGSAPPVKLAAKAAPAGLVAQPAQVARVRNSTDAELQELLLVDLPHLSNHPDLRQAYSNRIKEAETEVSRIGEHDDRDGVTHRNYALHLGPASHPLIIATVRTVLFKAEETALIFQGATAVDFAICGGLASRAAEEMKEFGAKDVSAVSLLPGLCDWVQVAEAWQRFPPPGRDAVEAVAKRRPRPGHSVLGAGTFKDAEAAWKTLALGYAECTTEGEALMYRSAGARLIGVNYMHETSEEALNASAGTTAIYAFTFQPSA
ncbi:hypothetical protein M885DRAFT_521457 [Pelagophyceae sp. CCMP2097]|nr:hypothetical protein M885DRAFT_521457 [Pelagophyceae sp. CCMP2097]